MSKLSNLSVLLLDNVVSYYWIGFLLADGHFSEKRLKLCLGNKDINHLKSFANFVSYQGIQKSSISCMDAKIVPKIRKKFKICNRKTYMPPNISNINNSDLFMSLIIGLIDGDGSIVKLHNRKDFQIRIKCHSSWLNNLQLISSAVSKLSNTNMVNAYINNQGYASLIISNSIACKCIKGFAIKHNLPVLNRKWSKIDMHYISRQELSKQRVEIVKNMLSNDKRNIEIANYLGLTRSAISTIIKRNNLQKWRK